MAISGRLQGPPLDGDIEQYSRTNGQWVLTSGPPTATGGGVYLANPIFGAVMDGVHDDSAAFASAVAATPSGGTLYLPSAPVLLASNQVPNKPINIRGLGWWCQVNATFGSPQWATVNYGTNFGGSILIFASTSGTALPLGPFPASTMNDVMMVGPGSGSSTGLSITNQVPAHLGGNVLVANFFNGIVASSLQSCSANAFKTRGCFNGIALTNAINNCVLNGWGADTCSAGGVGLNVPAAGAQGTVLYAFESQGNLGAIANIVGGDGLTIGPGSYFSNPSATSGITVTGGTVYVQGIVRSTPGDTISITNGNVTMVASRGTAVISINGGNLWSVGDLGVVPTVTSGNWFRIMPDTSSNSSLFTSVAIPSGQYFMLNGPTDTVSSVRRDPATGDTVISAGSGLVRLVSAASVAGNPTTPLQVAPKQYVDSSIAAFFGYIQGATNPSTVTVGASNTTIMTQSFPVTNGRRYRADVVLNGNQSGATGNVNVQVNDDQGGSAIVASHAGIAAGSGLTHPGYYFFKANSTRTATITLLALVTAGSLSCPAGFSRVDITDVGPN